MRFTARRRQWIRQHRVAIDAGIVALVVALLWVLLHKYDVFEEFYEFSRSHEDWDLDEVALAIVILPLPLLWFAMRRALDSTRAARRTWEIERELSHARKLESLGTLAGGMAHELNNQLQPVLALSELLVTQAGPDDPNARKYQLINQGAVRARGTVLRVLNFARRDSDQSGGKATSDTLFNLVDFLEITCPSSIKFTTEVDDDIGEIKMAIQDIESVVVNLVSNAIAAMEGRSGELLVRVKAQQKQVGSALVPSVLIEVKDDGIGIMPEYKDRIFEPFFTTKDVGKGTGLGMWQVQALVNDAKGSIWFESVPDKGTRFFVELPVEPRATD